MGYYVNITENSMFIKKENFELCYEAMCALNNNNDIKNGGAYGKNIQYVKGNEWDENKWFSWMPWNYPETCKTFISILAELGFEYNLDEEGNLVWLNYSSKIGQEDLFFKAIAPFVNKGSYVNWMGEDNLMWQWYFDGKELIEKTAVIRYE